MEISKKTQKIAGYALGAVMAAGVMTGIGNAAMNSDAYYSNILDGHAIEMQMTQSGIHAPEKGSIDLSNGAKAAMEYYSSIEDGQFKGSDISTMLEIVKEYSGANAARIDIQPDRPTDSLSINMDNLQSLVKDKVAEVDHQVDLDNSGPKT